MHRTPVTVNGRRLTACALAILTFAGSGAGATTRSASGPAQAVPWHHGWSFYGNQSGAELGMSIAFLGDVNGDGHDDVAVGAPGHDGAEADMGRVLVFHGTATGLGSSPSWTATGPMAAASFGSAVAAAGDVNGDGYGDLIVGAEHYNNDATREGAAFVFHGSATGLSATPDWTAEGNQAGAWFGASVAGGIDVNADGYDDVVIGAPFMDTQLSDAGCAYAYYGSAAGLTGPADWEVCGESSEARFGWSVAAAESVNGDAWPDVVIGSPGFTSSKVLEGKAYAYFATADGLPASPGWSAVGNQERAWFGWSVSGAGNVNGDAYADIAVGADGYDGAAVDAGRVSVFHGGATGPATAASWTYDADQAEASLGIAVAHADVNGDGFADIVAGAPGWDGAKPTDGRAFAFLGSAGGLAATPARGAAGMQVDAGYGVALAAGRLDGDARDDVLVGAPGHGAAAPGSGAVFALLGATSDRAAITVTSDADDARAGDATWGDGQCADADGRCTLRAAIEEANASRGPDRITFSRAMTITVDAATGELPDLVDQATVDASGVWDSARDRPGVTLVGPSANLVGLDVAADGCEIYGLHVTGFSHTAIYLSRANVTIGGPAPGHRNVLTRNGTAVSMVGTASHHNVVQSNYVGLAPDGETVAANMIGVWVAQGASQNLIGGWQDGRGNLVSGNAMYGVYIQDVGTDANLVAGGAIGLTATGGTGVGNGTGVRVGLGADLTNIGWSAGRAAVLGSPPIGATAFAAAARGGGETEGAAAADRARWTSPTRRLAGRADDEGPGTSIAGNVGSGVHIVGAGGRVYVVGSAIRDNDGHGVSIEGRSDAWLGANVIRDNGGHGIAIAGLAAIGNAIAYNSITANGGRGIALLDGANGGVSPPAIVDAGPDGASGTACPDCEVAVCSDEVDECRHYHGAVTADESGAWSYEEALEGPNVTAFLRDAGGNTSELSAAFRIAEAPTPSTTATRTASPTPTPSATATATPTASPTATVSATLTTVLPPTDTPTSEPSVTPAEPSDTPTPASTMPATGTPTPTAAPTECPRTRLCLPIAYKLPK